MIPEFGQFALILALCLAIVQATVPLFGAVRGYTVWQRLARPLAYGHALFVFCAFFILMYAFISNDFSVAYVAENSNTHLPLFYRVTALWGAHEGSLLLWVTVLSIWTVLVARFSRSLPNDTIASVLSVLGMVSIGFLLFLLSDSNPFKRLLIDVPTNGQDLNPLLQDPGLITHPPMLYMGYVGFSVAFAFAISALIAGRLDSAWARWSRPWTLAAWSFLTLGITLGSWWSYRVLGWGGWWFWDPVENASFLPWLTGTALIHSLAVTEKRGAFKSWTVLLAILAFSLSLIGTFLVRSGILTSVHAFAVDPTRGAYILKFLFIVIGASLLLYAWRAPYIRGSGQFHLLSRETLLLSNNVLLIVAMATILLGTLYPLMIEALGLGKISVGAPYFNAVFLPLFLPLLFIMGIGPQTQWQSMSGKLLIKQFWLVLILSAGLAFILPVFIMDREPIYVALGLSFALWIIFTTMQGWVQRVRKLGQGAAGIKSLPLGQYGMMVAHIGLAITVMGITISSAYSVERNVRLAPGDNVTVGAYHFHFIKAYPITGPNFTGTGGEFRVSKQGKLITILHPEKRLFTLQGATTSKAAIDAGVFRDIYVVFGEPLGHRTWAVRLYVKPFIRWIWFGGLIILCGGVLAILDRRYRRYRRKP